MVRHNGISIDMKARTIAHRDIVRSFNTKTIFEKVCYFILGGGVSVEMAFFKFYGDDPEGGPLEGTKVINIQLDQWQHRFLTAMELEWRSHKIAGVSFYEIVPKFKLRDPKRFSHSAGVHGDGTHINTSIHHKGLTDV